MLLYRDVINSSFNIFGMYDSPFGQLAVICMWCVSGEFWLRLNIVKRQNKKN